MQILPRRSTSLSLAAIPTSNAAAQVRRNWADITEEVNPGAEEGFTLVQGRKRRRGSGNSPTTAAPSSNAGASRTIRRPQSSAGSVPRAQEIRATRAHIADARARQASSSEEHCVYIEHSPELEPFHYLRALDRMLGGTAGVIQITKVNGHQLLGLTNRGLAERLISEGLEVEGTLLRAFPFRKRAERITVGNLPFFVADSAVITALSPYGRVTSIAPKQMKAGPYVYVDGRRDVFITLHEGITIERLPTRLDINIKGQAWPAYLSSGIRCSRCHGQGHRRAICPLLAGLANNTRTAPPTTPAGVPPPTTPAPPQRSAAQPPAPTPSNPAMEVCSAPPVARAALHSSAPRPSPPAAPAFPMEETPPAPPPVTPAPSLQTPGSREPAAPTPDVEMSIVEETFASSTSSAKNATRVDLDAFIEGLPGVSFAKTDALGLGREEVLDLLSSRTKPQRKGPLLSPPQCDALVGLIGQILDLKPGHTSNLYKVLGQVKAELRTTPTVPPTPPLPAPRPSGPTPPTSHSEELMPAVMTPPPPALEDDPDLTQWQMSLSLFQIFMKEPDLGPTSKSACTVSTPHVYTCSTRPWWVVTACTVSTPHVYTCSTRPWWVVTACTVSTPHVYTRPCGHASRELPSFSPLASGITSRMATNLARAESPSKAEDKPVRLGSKAQPSAEITAKDILQNKNPIVLTKNQNYINPSAGSQDANSAAPVDLAAIPTSDAAAQVRRNWADITEEVNPGAEEGFTLVQGRKRRRGSANSPTAAAPSSNPGGSRTIRRPQPSAGSVPRAQEIRVTRAHIAEARARQASSSEEHCVYIEHSPELEPFHYLRALDRMLGGTAGVIQITKVNGHQLLGLTNRGLAERLISEGLEVEGTLLRAFPFRKRAERITVGNLPFFVADSAVITALSPYGRVTSIAPKQMKAGPYVYVDGRRDVFITLHEGITIERLPTRLDINIKGQAWPAYLSSGIRCSRCHGQGHRRAICPLLAGLANNTRTAPPTTPAGVPPPTTPAPPQRSAAQPPAPTPSNPAMEVCSAPPVARDALHSSAPRPSPPAAPAFPMEETPPAPPPVTPAPSLQTPGSREPAAPTPDVEMSIVEETFASSTSSAKNATRVDLDAFIEGLPSVSFAKTDALGLGREEVLDLLSSRTKAQRKGPLLSPPQCDALVGLIGQILDLKPGHTSNLYKVLGQVKAELRTTPTVPPTPPLPAPRPSGPTPPTSHSEELMPAVMTPPPPALEDDPDLTQWQMSLSLFQIFMKEPDLGPTSKSELRNPLIDKSGIYAKFDRLEALYLELVVLNEQYQEILLAKAEATDDEIDKEFEECEVYIMERYYLKARIREMREQDRDAQAKTSQIPPGASSASPNSETNNQKVIKLQTTSTSLSKSPEESMKNEIEGVEKEDSVKTARATEVKPAQAKARMLKEACSAPSIIDIEYEGKKGAMSAIKEKELNVAVKCNKVKDSETAVDSYVGVREAEAKNKANEAKAKPDKANLKGDGVNDSEAKPKGEGVKESEVNSKDGDKGDQVKESEGQKAGDEGDGKKDSEDEPKGDGVKDSKDEPKGDGVNDSEARPTGDTESKIKNRGDLQKLKGNPGDWLSRWGQFGRNNANEKYEDANLKDREDSEAKLKGDGVKDSETAIKGYEPVNNSRAVAEGADQVKISDETESIDDNEENEEGVVRVPASRKLVKVGPTRDAEFKIKDNYKETESQDLKTINKSDFAKSKDDKYNKGTDHDGNEAKNIDAEQGTDSTVGEKLDAEQGTDPKVEEKLDAEQGTDLKVEENLDAEQGTESKVEGYYWPRHLLFRNGSRATPMRPVFGDASFREHGALALRRIIRKSRFAERNSNSFEKKSKLCKSARRRPGCKFCRAGRPLSLAAIPTSNAAAQVRRNWADITEEVNPGAEEGFTLVQGRKRRRGSGNSPTTAAPSSNAGASRTIRRPQSSAGSVPRAQEIRATRAHIADARARQASSSEEHCVYIEHSPELEPFHYLRALDRMLGGTAGVIQITKVNGHQLLGLTNRGLAERLISEGLEVEGTLLRAFPFRKRAERITVGNLPFFVADSAVITALSPYGRVTSIAPKQMKAGPYVYVDGRRDVFITLHEGITIERLPTRLDINIKGQAWPAYLSSGIRCSRCHGQGHRRAICPLLAGLANNTRTAPPTTPAGVPPPTTPAPPQRSAAQPPAPTPSNPAMEVCSAPPVARDALHSSAPRPSPPAAPAFPMEETPPAPPPVTPAPSLQTPGSREPAAPTPDVEMSIVEETFASSTSSAKKRNESRPRCFHRGAPRRVLGQVKAELRTTPTVPPTPPLPAPRPSGPTPPTSHSEELMPAEMTPPPPALEDDPDLTQWQMSLSLFQIFMKEPDLGPTSKSGMSSSASPGSSESAGQEPGRPSIPAPTGGRISSENGNQKILKENSENRVYANPPAGVKDVNLAAARDVTLNLPAGTSSNGAARVLGNWADCIEDLSPGAEDDFTVVKTKKRRRESPNSPTAATPSSNSGGARSSRRLHSSARSVPRAQEIPTTRTHITEARARQASSSEDHCVYLEHGPELQPFHYLRALDRTLGGTAGVIQISKVNGHQLLGLANRGLAERLINEGLEVEGTLLRAFPFRKRAERITVGNLPFFVEDSAIINALKPYGRVTSIAPKLMKVGPYTYNDGRREAFIVLREGMTTERLPTRLEIPIKGEAWPAYLSSGIKCSRCHGQGHRRANCPLLVGRANNSRLAPPTPPAGVPSTPTSAPPQRSAAQLPAPAPSSTAMEISGSSHAARAISSSTAPRPSPPVAPAVPMEEAPPAPPPVTPAPSLQVPKNPVGPCSATPRHPEPTPPARPDFAAPRGPPPIQKTLGPAAPTQDVEMSIVEETTASSASSTRNATGDDLVAFIEGNPNVSFARTDALGLGREEVLDLLSSRTKAQRNGPLLSPPQCDALVGLIGQILDLKPGHTSNLYKVLGQVRAELTKTPAAAPTPPLPAPRPAETAPPAPQGEESAPAEVAYPPPLPVKMTDEARERWLFDLFKELNYRTFLIPLLSWTRPEQIIRAALHSGEERNDILGAHPNQRSILANFLGSVIEHARGDDQSALDQLSDFRSILYCKYTTCLHSAVRPRVARAPGFSPLASCEMSLDMPNSASPGSPGSAGQMPGRPSIQSPTGGKISKKNEFQKVISKENSEHQEYVNPPAGVRDANLAAARDDVTAPLTAASYSATIANPASLSWGDSEMAEMDANNGFTTVRTKKRRRVSPGSPAAAAPSSGTRGAGATRRPRSSTGWAPRAEEVRTTRAHIAEARARQASSTEDHCVYIERSPELEPYHYMRALDRMLGGTREVFQMTKMNGHFLVGLANRGLAERLVNEGLEVEGTLHRAFPFRKRAERITVGNLPFFVGDAAVISALSSFGRVTSIAPKLMKAGPYVYNDGRREAFIILREEMTIERLPTRLDISIKGEAWPAYLSSGIRCSRCRGQGHRRANCPMLAGRTTAPGPAAPTSPTSVPPATAPRLPQQPSARPPPPASPSSTMEVSDVPPASRAAPLPPAALQPSPPAPSALPLEDTPPAPPPVTPAPSLRTPGSREPAAPTPDVEMSIVEETFASSTSSAKNATRVDLDAFIEGLPSVSFAKTDALGLVREEVLDLLSSRTKAQRKGPLLSPPQCDALVGLIGQILDLKPGHTSNLYKVLGQVRAELTKTPAAAPTPPLPAPRPDGPIPPPPHGDTTTPDMATSPSPLFQAEEDLTSKRWDEAADIIYKLCNERYSGPMTDLGITEGDITDAVIYPEDREPLLRTCSTQKKSLITEIISAAIERARDADPFVREGLYTLRRITRPWWVVTACTVSTPHVYTCSTRLWWVVTACTVSTPHVYTCSTRPWWVVTACTVSTPHVYTCSTRPWWVVTACTVSTPHVYTCSTRPWCVVTACTVSTPHVYTCSTRPWWVVTACTVSTPHVYTCSTRPWWVVTACTVSTPHVYTCSTRPWWVVTACTVSTPHVYTCSTRPWWVVTACTVSTPHVYTCSTRPWWVVTACTGRKRRRGSGNLPTTAAPSSNAGASRTIRRPQSSAGSVPRAQEIRATRAHIADARARQASSSEEHCVYIEHSPELEPFHYLRALDRMLGGTAGVIQITKVNGHQLLGLTNRGLAERLISEGLEVEGTLLRAFPFRKRAERITVGNLPFFVADSAVITALSPHGRVTSIAPKQMKAGPYVYVDGRRDVFITLHEGITIERLPTRLDINIKGQAWPAYLSSGIRCSRCHGQGHRRAICPLLAGLANNTRTAPPTTPAGVPPPTTPAPPQRSAAQPPAPTPSNPAMEVCSAPPVARAALHSSAPRPSPPAAPAFPMEETPPAPPPVTPAPSLQTPGSREPAAPTPDVEMSIVEETFASSTSSAKNATRVDLDAFIEGLPSVSFAKTDALGLGREEVLDLLSSRTKAQRKGPLLSPPQCDALVGLIGQILDLKPGHTSNLYKVLGQVKAELRTTPTVPPTPPLPAPRPSGPTPPTSHSEELMPAVMTPPPPALEDDPDLTQWQ
ncbi:hypothetical protein LAZ67_5000512, partial [Cordylochernes scorpioides]